MQERIVKKQNRGFTLVELVIAMVLIVIVGTIAISVTLMVTRSQANFRINAESEAEMVRLESAFKDWIARFDREGCILTVSEGEISAEEGGATLRLKGGEGLTSELFKAGSSEKETKTLSLSTVVSVGFSRSGDLICCTAVLKESDYAHRILYTLRAAHAA